MEHTPSGLSSLPIPRIHSNLDELEAKLKKSNFPELAWKLDEYYFERSEGVISASPPKQQLSRSSLLTHDSHSSLTEPPTSKHTLIVPNNSSQAKDLLPPNSLEPSLPSAFSSESPTDPLLPQQTGPTPLDPSNEFLLSNPSSTRIPPLKNLKPLPLSSLSPVSANISPLPSLLKEPPLLPITPLSSKPEEDTFGKDQQYVTNSPKAEADRDLPPTTFNKRFLLKSKKKKDIESEKRLEKALERLESEIPAVLQFDIIEEVLPIVKKMYDLYATQLGEKDELTQLTLRHVEELQSMLPSSYNRHPMLHLDSYHNHSNTGEDGMQSIFRPSSSPNKFDKKKRDPKLLVKKDTYVRMDDILGSRSKSSWRNLFS